ncbi:hypothetical protein B0H63DRAFT_156295 [Podospora didyma]|uniref:Uncharacterized protein n=1 Tax=Podospora didyma TaxID=330526 RepID=A0AAE0NTB1_9PEZI|nr:hypothetical protein B0H63DRAFT_156295 [Podospora didyma]
MDGPLAAHHQAVSSDEFCHAHPEASLRPAPLRIRGRATRRSKIIDNIADVGSLSLGTLMTIVALNGSQTKQGTCPRPEDDHRWTAFIPPLRHLPRPLRCPNLLLVLAAMFIYFCVAIFHLLPRKCPRYWPDFGLFALVVSLASGVYFGSFVMVDAMVLGGYLSLLASKIVDQLVRKQLSNDSETTRSYKQLPVPSDV